MVEFDEFVDADSRDNVAQSGFVSMFPVTVFVEESGVTVQKPRAASTRDMAKNSVMLTLTTDGKIIYGGRQIALNGVRGLVAQQLRAKDVPVIIIADESARTGTLVDLIDECKLAGAKNVSIAAERE